VEQAFWPAMPPFLAAFFHAQLSNRLITQIPDSEAGWRRSSTQSQFASVRVITPRMFHCASQPKENRKATQISPIRVAPSLPTRFPRRCCDTVTALCKLTAQGAFMPSSSSSWTSDGTPRMVDVIGATVTVDR